jgi:predicted DCC family thiol-disulfide oxidoreductase YuxK
MTGTEHNAIEGRALLLYDGVCALCHGVVAFLMKRDCGDRFRFVPLESDLGREVLARFDIHAFPEGVVLLTDALTPREQLYHRSDAFAAALERLSAPWRAMGRALRLVPRPLREWGYRMVARYRYRIFGRYDACPMPPPEQRTRLLGAHD